jgi:hypothetical protein
MKTVLAILNCAAALAAQPEAGMPFERLSFLLGEWAGAGGTELGNAQGGASFTAELDRHIIVRRDQVAYRSGKAAGTRHDDLLVIRGEGAG